MKQKNTIKRQIALVIFCLIAFGLTAQPPHPNGNQRVGPPTRKYSKLTRYGGIFTQYFQSAKAMGVYQSASLQPESWLEVNSTPAYSQFKHPNVATRGEVFRTVSPYNFAAYWRLIQGTTEIGLLYSLANDDDFNIQASAANMKFFIPGPLPLLTPAERVHI